MNNLYAVHFNSTPHLEIMKKVCQKSIEENMPDWKLNIIEVEPFPPLHKKHVGLRAHFHYTKLKYLCEITDPNPFIMIDLDTIVLKSLDIFDRDFSIAFTKRTNQHSPINTGVVFVKKDTGLLKQWLEIGTEMYEDYVLLEKYIRRHKGLGQSALGALLRRFSPEGILYLPCKEFNACEDDWQSSLPDTRVLHLKHPTIYTDIMGKTNNYPYIMEVFNKYLQKC